MVESQVVGIKGTKDIMQPAAGGPILVEDVFPPLDISDPKVEQKLQEWFISDLLRCVRHLRGYVDTWDRYRAMYDLELIEHCYDDLGGRADFAAGLLLEKMLEARDRLKRAILGMQPMFAVDTKSSGVSDIDFVQRLERFIDNYIRDDLGIEELIGKEGLYEFLMDGSLILEIDPLYRVVNKKGYKLYANSEELQEDEGMVLDPSALEDAYANLEQGTPVKLIVEKEVVERPGLGLEIVDKRDHLVPPGIYFDKDLRFRAKRYYWTKSDLLTLASSGVKWYRREDVDRVLNYRKDGMSLDDGTRPDCYDRMVHDGPDGSEYTPLGYDWQDAGSELTSRGSLPYEDVFTVYRILAKYGYPTNQDKEGLIPKFCVFDFEPDTQMILRARVYPHFDEELPYLHAKLGYRKKCYYGYGFGQLLYEEDGRQTSLLNLFLDGTAMASNPPWISVHPREGGIVPFKGGMGPGQAGYLRQIGDFKMLEVATPPDALLARLYPISESSASNRTSQTSLTQGKSESDDPRAPARKTQMLLGQALVGTESMLGDWANAWEKLPGLVQRFLYESALILGADRFEDIVESVETEDLRDTAKVTLEELGRPIRWKSQASAGIVNPEARKTDAIKLYTFFLPFIQQLQQVSPKLFLEYGWRWISWMAVELELRNAQWLIPKKEELTASPEALLQAMQQQGAALSSGPDVIPPQVPEPPEGAGGAPPEEVPPEIALTGGEGGI